MALRLGTTLLCAAAALMVWAATAAAQNFIGAERCGRCHPFAYQRWKAGPHASAHRSLTDKQRADAKCSGCHTTEERTSSGGAPLSGVQCERCHGPGKYYFPDYVMRDRELSRAVGLVDPNVDHCKQCHTQGAPSIRPFDFATMWAEIDHAKKAREAWEAALADEQVGGQ